MRASIDPGEDIVSPRVGETEAENLLIPCSLSVIARSCALLIVNFLHYQQR